MSETHHTHKQIWHDTNTGDQLVRVKEFDARGFHCNSTLISHLHTGELSIASKQTYPYTDSATRALDYYLNFLRGQRVDGSVDYTEQGEPRTTSEQ